MQAFRGTLSWYSTPSPPKNVCGVQVKACPSIGRRFIHWAMSTLGIDKAVPQKTAVSAATAATPATVPGRLRLAIVGDVHCAWLGEREEVALRFLCPDLTLLVGDFGNEDVDLVRDVAEMPLPKAVILGNHDAWFTMTGRSGSLARRGGIQQTLSAADMLAAMAQGGGAAAAAAAAAESQDCVRQQLAALGTSHVGYGTTPLAELGYTVVGARPFSKGGKNFSSIRAFMEDLYGVTTMEESAQRIVQVAESAPAQHALVLMGHNGPAGLGSRAFDICGVDWEKDGGDHGDPDLQAALAALHQAGRRVALVTFGHMHHTLHGANSRGRASRLRRMVALDAATGTVFLNAATVPRVTVAPSSFTPPSNAAVPSPSSSSLKPPSSRASPTALKSYGSGKRARMAAKAAAAAAAAAAMAESGPAAEARSRGSDTATQHHFMVTDLERGEVILARDVWVQITPVTDGTAAAVLQAATAEGSESSGSDSDVSSDEALDSVHANVTTMGPCRIGDFIVQIVRDHIVLRTVQGENGSRVKFIWNAHDQVYEPHIVDSGSAATSPVGAECDDRENDEARAVGVATPARVGV